MIWKIAVALMLLASTTFGAATLHGPSGDLTAPATVVLSLADVTSPINGVDIYPVGVPAGAVKVMEWTILDPVMTSRINTVTTFAPGTDLVGVFNDWGVRSPSASNGNANGGPLVKLVLDLAPGVTKQDVTLSGYWADTGFDEGECGAVSFTLKPIPEPASMLLLAAGAAFFARRRRA